MKFAQNMFTYTLKRKHDSLTKLSIFFNIFYFFLKKVKEELYLTVSKPFFIIFARDPFWILLANVEVTAKTAAKCHALGAFAPLAQVMFAEGSFYR